MNNYTLHPDGIAAIEAEIEKFKQRCKDAADDALSNVYADLAGYIEHDAILNLEQRIINGFHDGAKRHIQDAYPFARMRAKLFEEHRDEIMAAMPEELVKENDMLRSRLSYYENRSYPS
jgi:hypothetical protein